MARARVTFSNGRTAVIEGPSREAVQAEIDKIEAGLRAEAGAETKKQPGKDYDDLSGENALTRGAMGFARPIVETVYGAKQLIGKAGEALGIENDLDELTPDQQRVLDTSRQDLGTAGTVGRVAGEVATFAVPGGAGAKIGTKLATRAPQALKYAPAAADVVTTAAMEGVKAPSEDRDRVDAMIEGALGGAIGRAAANTLAVGLRGLKPSEQAAKVIAYAKENGIKLRLTPGQIKGGFVQKLESASERLPGVGLLVGKQKKDALLDWNRAVVGDVSPPLGKGVLASGLRAEEAGALDSGARKLLDDMRPQAGNRGIGRTKEQFSRDYDWLLHNPDTQPNFGQAWMDSAAQRVDELGEQLPVGLRRKFRSDMGSFLTRIVPRADDAATSASEHMDMVDDLFRARIRAASRAGDVDLASAYRAMRTHFRSAFGEENSANWAALDDQYRKFSAVRKASSGARATEDGGTFTPGDLVRTTSRPSNPITDLSKRATEAGQVIGFGDPGSHALSQVILGGAGLAAGGLHAAWPAVVAAAVYNPVTRKLISPGSNNWATKTAMKIAKATGVPMSEARRLATQLGAAVTKAKMDPTTEKEFVSRLEALQQQQPEEDETRNPYRVKSVEQVK